MNRGVLGSYVRTLVHLRPSQFAHRARLRAQLSVLRRFPEAGRVILSGPDPSAAVGWPDVVRPVDALTPGLWPTLPELQKGKIRLLGLERDLEDAFGWDHGDAPRLWRFHLHYWDWAWGLATDPDRMAARVLFARLWRSWQASAEFGRGDAWHPYPASLRAWSWCGMHRDLVTDSEIEPEFVAGLAAHAGFLRRHLEYDLGGNHLIKNLKALIGLAVFFADERLLKWALRRLAGQLTKQVLADGGHYERSPAYHCQVLADLMDVTDLLHASGQPTADEITEAVGRMRRWLGAVLGPDGQVPMLNDGYPVDRELLDVLRPDPVNPASPLLVLPETGLVRAVVGEWRLLADVGPPCPPSLPGHAHADTLSCLLYVETLPLLIDTGTSTYEPGAVRRHERSTAAHSTVELDGTDSTEVWDVFRVGRRARVSGLATHADSSCVTCEAVHDGFRCLSGRPLHRRRWALTSEGLRVDDAISGKGRHEICLRWQLAVGSAARIADGMALITGPVGAFSVTTTATAAVLLAAETRPVAAGFGSTTDAVVLTCRIDATLPVYVTTIWSRARDRAGREETI
jgi:uncharacterized heparinase superfamily protein